MGVHRGTKGFYQPLFGFVDRQFTHQSQKKILVRMGIHRV